MLSSTRKSPLLILAVLSIFFESSTTFAANNSDENDTHQREYSRPTNLPDCPPKHICQWVSKPTQPDSSGGGSGGRGMGTQGSGATGVQIDERTRQIDRSNLRIE